MEKSKFLALAAVHVAILCSAQASRSQGTAEFESFFGGPWSDGARSLVRLSDGGFALGGWKTRESQPERKDGWVIRVDERGRYIWDLPISGTGNDGVLALTPALDGGLFAVTDSSQESNSNARLIKISDRGTLEWSRTYGGPGKDRIFSLRPTFDGGLIMAGRSSTGTRSDGNSWVVKLDDEFEIQWFRTFGTVGNDAVADVAIMPNGDYAAVGFQAGTGQRPLGWAVRIDSLGATVWENNYDLGDGTYFKGVHALKNGAFIFAANVNEGTVDSTTKTVLGGLNHKGDITWQRNVEAAGSISVVDITQRTDGVMLAAANVDDDEGVDGMVVDFTVDGTFKSVTRRGGERNNQILAIAPLGASSYALGGVSVDQPSTNADVWLVIDRSIMQSGTILE